MKRPRPIPTTVRSPDRVIPLLCTLKRIEGELFDYDRQVKFQTPLIQDKKFRPNDLTDDDERRKFDTAEEITFAKAKSMFEKQNYVDPGTSTDSDDRVKNRIPAATESWEGEVL